MAELFDMKELEERVILVAVRYRRGDGDRTSGAEPGEDSSRHLSGQWKDRGTAGDGLGNGRNRCDLRR